MEFFTYKQHPPIKVDMVNTFEKQTDDGLEFPGYSVIRMREERFNIVFFLEVNSIDQKTYQKWSFDKKEDRDMVFMGLISEIEEKE